MPDHAEWRVVVWRGAIRSPWRCFAGDNLDEILAGASDDTMPSTSIWNRWEAFTDDELKTLRTGVFGALADKEDGGDPAADRLLSELDMEVGRRQGDNA